MSWKRENPGSAFLSVPGSFRSREAAGRRLQMCASRPYVAEWDTNTAYHVTLNRAGQIHVSARTRVPAREYITVGVYIQTVRPRVKLSAKLRNGEFGDIQMTLVTEEREVQRRTHFLAVAEKQDRLCLCARSAGDGHAGPPGSRTLQCFLSSSARCALNRCHRRSALMGLSIQYD